MEREMWSAKVSSCPHSDGQARANNASGKRAKIGPGLTWRYCDAYRGMSLFFGCQFKSPGQRAQGRRGREFSRQVDFAISGKVEAMLIHRASRPGLRTTPGPIRGTVARQPYGCAFSYPT